MSTTPELVVVTPWYPTPEEPHHGVFVRDAVRALGFEPAQVRVVHLRRCGLGTTESMHTAPTPEGELVRIDVPVAAGTSRAKVSDLQRSALLEHRVLAGARVAHAHVGLPTGWAVAHAAEPGTRVVVTEHATYLREELLSRSGRERYGQMLRRTDVLAAVTEGEAGAVRALYADLAHRVIAVGNPVREPGAVHPSPGALRGPPDRWLYIGNLVPRKRVGLLLDSFAQYRGAHPQAALTVVGTGPQEEALRRRAEALGLTGSVRFAGPRDPDDLPGFLAAADVLVHVSAYETFGLTPVEAVLAGLPVVVTRCGGPEEVLHEAAAARLATFVPTDPTAAQVAGAVAGLSDSPPDSRAGAVLDDLRATVGRRGWGARMRAVLAAQQPDGPLGPRGVVVLAMSPEGNRRVTLMAPTVLRAGVRMLVLTNSSRIASQLDPRVQVIDVEAATRWSPVHVLETVFTGAPQMVLAGFERLIGLGCSLPRLPGRVARAGQRRVGGLRDRMRRAAELLHEKVMHPALHAVLDPLPNAVHVERRRLAELDSFTPDHVLWADSESLATAWRIARARPGWPVARLPGTLDLRDLLRAG
ncbi:glycosyltransferase [Ruania alkalisoli]|uniref:Glycosyltransferase n=1 Tax=Ruania alkalisoli TaxID=2779775 RepID=A0A7M1SQC9_9MICO|nr:glycosyltransferase [Ruania alkalisoli]QOR69779.1 glycosyltransferase [Ruania alkalisoli]